MTTPSPDPTPAPVSEAELEALAQLYYAALPREEWARRDGPLNLTADGARLWYGDGDEAGTIHDNLGLDIWAAPVAAWLAAINNAGPRLLRDLRAARAEVERVRNASYHAFVAGAKWWEFHSTGGTMWQSDQGLVHDEATKRWPYAPHGLVREQELRADAAESALAAEQQARAEAERRFLDATEDLGRANLRLVAEERAYDAATQLRNEAEQARDAAEQARAEAEAEADDLTNALANERKARAAAEAKAARFAALLCANHAGLLDSGFGYSGCMLCVNGEAALRVEAAETKASDLANALGRALAEVADAEAKAGEMPQRNGGRMTCEHCKAAESRAEAAGREAEEARAELAKVRAAAERTT